METVDAGQEIVYTLALRNSGDGAAKRLNARIDTPSNTVYAPGSTTVNELSLLDFAGTSPLLAPNGLTLGDVGSGAEVIVQLKIALVMILLKPGPPSEWTREARRGSYPLACMETDFAPRNRTPEVSRNCRSGHACCQAIYSIFSISATEASPRRRTSHSHTVTTCQPSALSFASFCRSRCAFRRSFDCQYSVLLRGVGIWQRGH